MSLMTGAGELDFGQISEWLDKVCARASIHPKRISPVEEEEKPQAPSTKTADSPAGKSGFKGGAKGDQLTDRVDSPKSEFGKGISSSGKGSAGKGSKVASPHTTRPGKGKGRK